MSSQRSAELLIATKNRGKLSEIAARLREIRLNARLFTLDDLDISVDYDETGTTFKENAVGKAVYYSTMAEGVLTLADDSGLEVAALNGEPGIYSARFAGEPKNDDSNNNKLLSLLEGNKEREARFVCEMALALDGKLISTFHGTVSGTILEKKQGSGGFGYDPLFFYPPESATFAELNREIKNQISHRGNALGELIRFLRDYPPFNP